MGVFGTCAVCNRYIMPGNHFSEFLRLGVERPCRHFKEQYICDGCDDRFIARVLKGNQTCFERDCTQYLRPDLDGIVAKLSGDPDKVTMYGL